MWIAISLIQDLNSCRHVHFLQRWPLYHGDLLLLNVGSLSSYRHNPGQHYLPQEHDIGLGVEVEVMWEDEWRHNFTIASNHPKYHDVDWVFGFHHCCYILWGQSKSMVLWIDPLILAEIFIWENQHAWVGWKVLQCSLSTYLLWPVLKIVPFSSSMKNAECLYECLPTW